MRDGFATKSDARGAVVPGAADVELDVFPVGFVFEGDGRLVGEDCDGQRGFGGERGVGTATRDGRWGIGARCF